MLSHDGYSYFIWWGGREEDFTEICQENSSLVKIKQKYLAQYMKT
jgi:hypothetical protein